LFAWWEQGLSLVELFVCLVGTGAFLGGTFYLLGGNRPFPWWNFLFAWWKQGLSLVELFTCFKKFDIPTYLTEKRPGC
jgi:hypothetical protein